MTKSDQIRDLAKQGLATADIARQLGIRYQHAYNVLKNSGVSAHKSKRASRAKPIIAKPTLYEKNLVEAGFETHSYWKSDEAGGIELSEKLPSEQGVYAFCIDGVAQYVGVATMGLAKRIYFYKKPGSSQKTSIRINDKINRLVEKSIEVRLLIANPDDLEWNGLPVHGCAGLELGLIKKYELPWNMRSSN